ncbi:hypothetical protein PIB30_011229 [Stylosanthes scabra]|uniref:Uncharacterized protein n=1 Tax=Stylosanthes scabra TaxID=79078 RepID=A0ABU6T655_9FABA|nr:hypothetical protein [Stylosanthes scabra]
MKQDLEVQYTTSECILLRDMPKQKRYKNLLKAAAAASASQDKSAATNPGTSSRTSSMAPTTSDDSFGARCKLGRESKRYWKVMAIDEYGVETEETEEHLLSKDVHDLAEA